MNETLRTEVAAHPYPLVFATVSGAHLYGFPSEDSDYDLRGVHVLPVREVIGLDPGRETVELSHEREGREIDLVTHDVKKFFALLLKKNGYVLEQIYSPLVVHTTPAHAELKDLAKGCITRHHAHHYLGFSATQWKLFEKERPPRVKPLLYVYRVLLTGIHLMRTGCVEANLVTLNAEFDLGYIPELIERKVAGKEEALLPEADIEFYRSEYERLTRELEEASTGSALPEKPSALAGLNDLLLRIRTSAGGTGARHSEGLLVASPPPPDRMDCPVCGRAAEFEGDGSYEICGRCGWENDPVQFENPDLTGGANRMSLRHAREAWASGKRAT